MLVEKIFNLLDKQSFQGKKDPSKVYNNVTLLGDDTTFKFQFVKEEDFKQLQNAKRLDQVKCIVDFFVAGNDSQGNVIYSCKLVSIDGIVK